MSEDRFEQEEAKDLDVEGHKHHFKGTDDSASDEKEDDVEAHKHHFKGNDEPGSEESDDVEAHGYRPR
jgi:hypothetical protein